jgi:hypothetical protein
LEEEKKKKRRRSDDRESINSRILFFFFDWFLSFIFSFYPSLSFASVERSVSDL